MKAIIVEAFGDADRLRITDRPHPEPGPGEAVVAVEAAGVGFVDVMARQGRYLFDEPGFVPGIEVAGTVVATGAGVETDLQGRRVFATPVRGGGYAERVAVPVKRLAILPDDVSAEQAVSLGINALVAMLGMDRLALRPGEAVFVRGASGGIGLMALQLAVLAGGDVTATASGEDRARRLTDLGAVRTWDRHADAPLPRDAFDAIVDVVSGQELKAFIGRLRANGRYLLCGGAAGAPTPDFGTALMENYHKSIAFHIFSLNSAPPPLVAQGVRRVFTLFREGRLRAVTDSVLPLAEAARAHRRLEAGEAFGKIVLTP